MHISEIYSVENNKILFMVVSTCKCFLLVIAQFGKSYFEEKRLDRLFSQLGFIIKKIYP